MSIYVLLEKHDGLDDDLLVLEGSAQFNFFQGKKDVYCQLKQ